MNILIKKTQFKCSACSIIPRTFGTFEDHVRRHFQLGVKVKCPKNGCFSIFFRKCTLIKHMKEHCYFGLFDHDQSSPQSTPNILSTVANSHDQGKMIDSNHVQVSPSQEQVDRERIPVSKDSNAEDIGERIVKDVSSLLVYFNSSKNVPFSLLQNYTEQLINILLPALKEGEMRADVIYQTVKSVISSSVKVNSIFKDCHPFIAPQKLEVYSKHGYYCSIKATLGAMFESKEVCRMIKEDFSKDPSTDGRIKSFKDGSRYGEKYKKCLRLALFVDDFNLDTQGKSSKNGALAAYLVVENLGYHFITKAYHLPLVLMVRRKYCKKAQEIKHFFSPLIDDLEDLNSNGIEFDGEMIKCQLLWICGDSKGKAELLQLVNVFSSGAICCMCKIDFDQLQGNFMEFAKAEHCRTDESRLATMNQLANRRMTPKAFKKAKNKIGVLGNPILHGISYINFRELYTVDSFHDNVRGVIEFHLVQYLQLFLGIESHEMRANDIKERIKAFNYKVEQFEHFPEKSSIAVTRKKASNEIFLTHRKGHHILDLFRYLFEILVQETFKSERTRKAIETYNKLRYIICIVDSNDISKECLGDLPQKILEYKESFKNLFPEYKFKPKDHFLEHYPQFILENGPTKIFNSLPYERANYVHRKMIGANCFFNKAEMTIANKSVRATAFAMKKFDDQRYHVTIGKTFELTRAMFDMENQITRMVFNDQIDVVKAASRLMYHGKKFQSEKMYKVNMGLEPFFLSLHFILLETDPYQLVGERIDVIGFDDDQFSYVIKFTGNICKCSCLQITDGSAYHSFLRGGRHLVTRII